MSMETPKPQSVHTLSLNYAGPRAANEMRSEVFLAVEDLIDRRAPLDEIRSHFKTGQEAAEYVARSLTRRFAVDRCTSECSSCGKVMASLAMQVAWKLVVDRWHTRTTTYHSTCSQCAGRWRSRHRVSTWIRRTAALLSLTCIVSFWLSVRFRWLPAQSHVRDHLFFALLGVVFVGMLVIVIAGELRKWSVPTAIRRLLPRHLMPKELREVQLLKVIARA